MNSPFRRFMILTTLGLLACLLAAPSPNGLCRADEASGESGKVWSPWRGPNHTGVVAEADPPTTWGEDKNVKWKIAIPGRGSATPIVWGDRIFILTAIKTDREKEKPPEEKAPEEKPSDEKSKEGNTEKKPENRSQSRTNARPSAGRFQFASQQTQPEKETKADEAKKGETKKEDSKEKPAARRGPGAGRDGRGGQSGNRGRGGYRGPGGFGGQGFGGQGFGGRGRGRGGRGFGRSKPTHFYQFTIMCLDRETGEVMWQEIATELVPHEAGHRTNTLASGSPVTDGKHVWASFGSHGIFCYTVDGKKVWERDLGEMRTRAGFGEGGSPTLYKDNLIVNWDHEGPSFIEVLDAKTGETRWKKDRDEPTSWNTPLVVEHNGRTQVIVNGTKRSRAYDLETGDVIWECGGQATSPIATSVTLDGVVYCMTGFRGYKLNAIPLDSEGDLTKEKEKLVWTRSKSTPYVPSPLLYGDRLYLTKSNNAILSCLDAKTGEELFAEKRLEGIRSIYASPVGAGGRIYITGRGGATVVLKHADELEVLATNKLDDPIDASPAIVGNQMFLRGAKHLYCLEEE